LAEEIPLQLGVKSKADRGYALLAAKTIEAVKAAPVMLAPNSDVQSAIRAIARTCLHQLVANQPVMLKGAPEGLHQMRVALRRLRAVIPLFPGILADPQTNALKAEFKWITSELGPARELDVFLKRVVSPVSDHRRSKGEMALITRELRRKRKAAYERAQAAVDSARFRNFVFDTAAWIEAGDWADDTDNLVSALREGPIIPLATEQLNRRRKAILKKGKRLSELHPRRRHKLRIQAKKLRYAAEFFAGVFPARKSKRRLEVFVERLSRLQDALGDLNDIAVHEELSAQLIQGGDAGGNKRHERQAGKAFAAGRLSGHEEARIGPVLKEAKRAYAVFAKAKPFWT
jgi:CHAD domain-containing protein